MSLDDVKESRASGARAQSNENGCKTEPPEPAAIVILGASGDLTKRKIIPSLYMLNKSGLLPDGLCVLGAARTKMSEDEFRSVMCEAVKNAHPDEYTDRDWDALAAKLYYQRVDYSKAESFTELGARLPELERRHSTGGNRIFYLAVPPTVYRPVIRNLGEAGLSAEERGYTHVIIEKPFGRDLGSAIELNETVKGYFSERQVYRMDHYLAKETVQNVILFRFANSIFEPLWNRRYVDHVQITVAETLGVEHRAGYYENAGVLRDMFQNHIFQLMALTAMEPPSEFQADMVREEKVKVFRSVRPVPLERLSEHVVLGQYGAGSNLRGYREEPGVSPESTSPTFAALRLYVDNWRWKGVPFFLRSGKRLARRKAEISVHFKAVPHMIFQNEAVEEIEPNTLVLRIQPHEGIEVSFQTKLPGSKLCLNPVKMDFSYEMENASLGGYERVLLDSMHGDQTLFVRQDAVERTWELLTPVIEKLEAETVPEAFPNYEAGSEGPAEANRLIESTGRAWRPV